MELLVDGTCQVDGLGLFTVDGEHSLRLRLDILDIVHQLFSVCVTGETFDRLDFHIDDDTAFLTHRDLTPSLLDTASVGSVCLVTDKD